AAGRRLHGPAHAGRARGRWAGVLRGRNETRRVAARRPLAEDGTSPHRPGACRLGRRPGTITQEPSGPSSLNAAIRMLRTRVGEDFDPPRHSTSTLPPPDANPCTAVIQRVGDASASTSLRARTDTGTPPAPFGIPWASSVHCPPLAALST